MANVTVYSTHSCPWCTRAKKFLDDNGVKYVIHYVDDDHEKAQEMFDKSGQMGVPVLDINGEIVVGFNEPKIRQLLSIK